MWNFLQIAAIWHEVGAGAAWLVTICLLITGLVGCVLPMLPGHVIIIIGAAAHWIMLRDASGLAWWSFLVLVALAVISQIFETVSGAAGAKKFGGTKWGALGALIGSIVGLFFLPVGLFLGPLIGAFAFEILIARKHPKPAAVSGVGSVVGTLAGMGMNLVMGLLMVGWFFLDVFLIGK
jgi:uncharacterized protein